MSIQEHDNVVTLIADLRAGHNPAFRKIIDRFTPELFGYARSLLKDPSCADDMVQETFIVLYEKRDNITDVEHIRRLLFLVLRHKCYDHNKKISTSALDAGITDTGVVDEASVVWKIAVAEVLAKIYRIVGTMTQKQQAIFFASFGKDLSLDEMAALLRLPKQTIKNQKTEVYKILREQLGNSSQLLLVIIEIYLKQKNI